MTLHPRETEFAESETLRLIWNRPPYLMASRGIGLDTVLTLASALKSHCGTAEGRHAERSGTLVDKVAARLGLGLEEMRTVWYAAVLHDIGKIGIPSSILGKPGKLDEREWEVIYRHPEIGAWMLLGIEGFEHVRAAVVAHHERFDGRGYPFGLAGSEIPLAARLISVVDAYDAMMHDRPYRKALGNKEAVRQLDLGSGSQFDPAMVEALKAVLELEL